MKLDFIDRMVVHHVEKQIENKDGSINMNELEALAVTMIMSVLSQVVKNPATKAEVQTQMVNVGTLILETYGYTVTPPPVAPKA